MENRRNVNIAGISSIYGGRFGSVSINGIGKIKEDIEATAFYNNGIGKVKGVIRSETIQNNGICRFQKDIHTKIVKNTGVFKLKGNLEAEEFTSCGMIYAQGNITVDKLKASFDKSSFSEGIFGDDIVIHLINDSKSINGPMWLLNLIFGLKLAYGKFVCNIIECTSLAADNLKVNTVRAQNVALGPGCLVELVEYYNSFSMDESSFVKKLIKL
jgi:hypothetical protein